MKMIYKLNTAGVYGMDYSQNAEAAEDGDEEWPPFRKVKLFNSIALHVACICNSSSDITKHTSS